MSLSSAMEKFTHEHTLSISSLRAIADIALSELQKGLAGEDSSFRMLESHVRNIPRGTETGTYYAFDLGGNNLRVIRVLLKGGCRADVQVHKTKVPQELMAVTSSAEELFGFIADTAEIACNKFGDLGSIEDLSVGFTFSFPIYQSALNKAVLVKWTKAFQTPGCVGEDVGRLMQEQLFKKGIPLKVDAICNDTVGTLVACALDHPDCKVGIILGTGCNAAYFEPETGSVINIEWGNLNKGLPRTDVDKLVDKESPNPENQLFEKMTSGMYLGKMVILNLMRARPDLDVPESAVGTFSGYQTTSIVEDSTSNLEVTQRVLKDFGMGNFTLEDRLDVKHIVEMVLNRSADLAAAALYAVLRKMGVSGEKPLTVGIDGSVYKLNPSYKSRMKYSLDRLLGLENHHVQIVDTEDGSGKGAALVVAASTAKLSTSKL